jgi:uncharacterized membrane protein
VRALRNPALGLVLVVLGLSALPQQLFTFVNVVLTDTLPVELLAMMLSQLAVAVLQLATGWAVIRGRAPTVWFAAYVAACVALMTVTAVLMLGEEMEPKIFIGIGLETLGLPLVIAIASTLYQGDHFEVERSPVDVVAMLLVFAVGALTMVPLDYAQTVRMLLGGSASAGTWIGMTIWPAVMLGLGILALTTARRFTPRALRIYVLVVIGVRIALALISIGVTLVESSGHSFRPQLIANQVIGLVSILGPLTLLMYVRPGAETVAPRAPSRVPVWLALSYVPMLLGRVFLADGMNAEWGSRPASLAIALTGTVAVVIVAMADAAFRLRPSARWWTLAAAVGGVAIVGAAVVMIFTTENQFRTRGLLAPLGHLLASTTVAAWLYRLPRV